jgi:hypothetical protein
MNSNLGFKSPKASKMYGLKKYQFQKKSLHEGEN